MNDTRATANQPTAGSIRQRLPRFAIISAWSIPVLLVGQFAMLAIVPIAALATVIVRRRIHPLFPYAGVLVGLYATGIAIWVVRPDRAQSLSRDLHPVLLTAIVVASLALLLRTYLRRK